LSTASGAINLNPAGNIVLSANTYINNLNSPVQDADAATKSYVDNLVSTQISYHQAVVAATTTTLATTTGGTITYTQPNGVANGVGALLTTTGSFNLIDTANVQTLGTRILVKNEANAVTNGIYTWANATNIVRSTDADQYGPNSDEQLSVNDYFFVTGGNVNLGSAYIVSAPTGAITFGTSNIDFNQFSSSQVYSANTNAGLTLVGQTFNAKVDNNTTAFDGSGNIVVKASANLTTPNIGAATGTSLSVTGNVAGGNVLTGGIVSATGSVIGGNLETDGAVLATGNVVGGNLKALGGVFASFGNVIGANINAIGNVFGNNINTSNNINATGNVTGGNVLTGGIICATGNITGSYFIGNGAQLTGIDTTLIQNGNSNVKVYANANVATSVGGNANVFLVTGDGTNITGTVSATGNITGNYFVGNGSQLTGITASSGAGNLWVVGRIATFYVPIINGILNIVGRAGNISVAINS
jgi:hypothetical protein